MTIRLLTLSAGLSLALFVFGPLGRSEDTPAAADQGVFDQLAVITADATAVTAELKKQPGVETQLKGAVHDAFAEAIQDPKPSPVVTKEPPKDLEEMPPTNKPDGEDVQWYGGYWDFDQDRTDFTWITGIYRKPPPRRQWTAGSWVKVDGGWQRQRGLWLTLEIASITFVPTAPPAALVEEAANTPPDNNSFYVPGNYEYKETSYVWKPGKWVPSYSNWVWIPAHWVWTPCGYAFVAGYWDYLIELRGLLYAPVCVDPAYITPGFVYTPCCVVHNTCLLDALFVRPGCGYFFGAYFQNKAYTSWPDACIHGKICDPLFSHYKQHQKGNWEGSLRALYSGRQSGKIAQPPSNLREFGKFVQDFKNKSIGANDVRHNLMIGSANKINTNVVRMRTLDNAGVQGQKKFSDQLRNAGKDLAFKQTQHLQSNRGSQNGGKAFKFDVDKSISSQFRSFNNGQNNGNKNGNGLGNVNGLGNRNGSNNNNNNNGQNGGNKDPKNGQSGSTFRNLQGSGNGQNNNGQSGGTFRNLQGSGNGQNNNGQSGGNKDSKNSQSGSTFRTLQGSGNTLQGSGNGQNNNGQNSSGQNGSKGFTPKSGNGGSSNGTGGAGSGSSTIRRFESGSSGSSGSKFIQGNNNGTPGGTGSGSNSTVIRRFEGSSSGNNGSSFQSGSSRFSQQFSPGSGSGSGSSGSSGSSGFSSKSFQGSSSGSFGGSSGSSGSSRSFGGSGGGGGGGGGGRRGR